MRRGDAWRLVHSVVKRKEIERARPEVWCMPTPSLTNPEGREFVVDSGASMHMLSQKDLDSSELETVRVSRTPVAVITANGGVHAKEEATAYVKELEL